MVSTRSRDRVSQPGEATTSAKSGSQDVLEAEGNQAEVMSRRVGRHAAPAKEEPTTPRGRSRTRAAAAAAQTPHELEPIPESPRAGAAQPE
ncbi:hypothetical protein MNEG_8878, partial [Monoraphidium neglectum]